MVRWKKRPIGLIAVLAIGIVAAACGGDDDDDGGGESGASGDTEVAEVEFTGSVEEGVDDCYSEPEAEDLTIGYANPLDANEAVNVEAKAMQFETEELGGEFLNVDANGDPDQQVSDIERLVAQRVDAIIVFPLDSKAVTPPLRRAQEAGIPTVGIEVNLDSENPGPGFDTQVWEQRDLDRKSVV